jgi:hypothetical protein
MCEKNLIKTNTTAPGYMGIDTIPFCDTVGELVGALDGGDDIG